MKREEFVAAVDQIGRSADKQATAFITLNDGSRYITYTYTINDEDEATVDFTDVHQIHGAVRMRVRRRSIVDHSVASEEYPLGVSQLPRLHRIHLDDGAVLTVDKDGADDNHTHGFFTEHRQVPVGSDAAGQIRVSYDEIKSVENYSTADLRHLPVS